MGCCTGRPCDLPNLLRGSAMVSRWKLRLMYAELHARSAFSFLEGASLPEELVAECARLEIPAIALVDTDNVSGAPRFYKAAMKAGIRPHIGAEITAAAGGRYVL